ncbi:MAG: prolyl aminopeptidase [Pseudomonadota bacterium]
MNQPRQTKFPEIEPYESGYLVLDNTHTMYWEQSGNPNGTPVLFLHGGPGGGCFPKHRCYFDPDYYRIILFDQRGAGRSTPLGETKNNTTPDLIQDIERLREHLCIDKWLIFGGSWGATLGLAYGQAHPERGLGFILRGVYLCRQSELDWFLKGVRHFFPEAWQRFFEFIPEVERDDLLRAYHKRIHHPDPKVHQPAAEHFNRFGITLLAMQPNEAEIEAMVREEFALPLARIETHYFVNDMFMSKNALLDNMHRIQHLPAILIHGRYDMTCPPVSAYELHRLWPGSELHMAPLAGHSSSDPGLCEKIIWATGKFKNCKVN